jgi:flavin reductase (DIM6/NTAB) family NADH-FMN oxidoreductase RutF
MAKISIGTNVFPVPMPVCLVGANVKGKPNFMAVAWFNRVGSNPVIFAAAINKAHLTAEGIEENGTFSINIPNIDMVPETDYCGIVSGRKKDKSGLFDVFYGELKTAPMISGCPISIELNLLQSVQLPSNTLYLGQVAAAFADESCLVDGKPDVRKIKPFVLTMPDNCYWALGELVGKAWSDGRKVGSKK